MITELCTLIRFLGLKKNLITRHAMLTAKSPIRGYVLTNCFWALNQIGFIDELEKNNADITSFCQNRNIDSTILSYITKYLARLGYLETKNQTVSWTKRGHKTWTEIEGVFDIFSSYEPFFKNLCELLKKNVSLKDIKRNDLSVALGFQKTGEQFTFPIMTQIVKKIHPKGVIELGCGNIDLSRHLLKNFPDIRFLGIDHDDRFLIRARQSMHAGKLNGHIQLLKRDIFDLTRDDADFAPYNLVTAIDLFHGYFTDGKEKLVRLFSNLRKTFSGKNFLISEVCLPDEKQMKRLAYPHVEHELFHDLTAQKTFKAGELEALLQESGFTIQKIWRVKNLAARVFIFCN
ncbi:MAG: methyltransferase [Candidatus Omnitrophica bacterium]|nr:methyltransferase [Candidatus Omnitrophota bacterium]